MFSLRLIACGIVFLLLVPSSGSAEPDFNITEIDVDWQLASLPLPPDLEPITTSSILEIAYLSRALKDRSTYLPAISEVAAANGVPPALVDAVVRIESRYNPTAVGSIGEIGLMQVRPKTAALLGFEGSSAELASRWRKGTPERPLGPACAPNSCPSDPSASGNAEKPDCIPLMQRRSQHAVCSITVCVDTDNQQCN